MDSERFEQCYFEWGPHSLLMTEEWRELFAELKLSPQRMRPGVRSRFVLQDNGLSALPLSVFSFAFGSFFSFREKLLILRNLFRKFPSLAELEDLSVFDFFKEILGLKMARDVVSAFMNGVYANDAKRLSASACFPELWDHLRSQKTLLRFLFEKSKKKTPIVSFRAGLAELVSALSHHLGDERRVEESIKAVHLEAEGHFLVQCRSQSFVAERVISALPAFELARIAEGSLGAEALELLKSVSYRDIAVWNCLWQRPEFFRPGLGALIPPRFEQRLLGSLWPSEMFEGRCAQDQLVTAQFFSGEAIPEDPEEELELIQKLLGLSSKPLVSEYRVHRKAIPQLGFGHRLRMLRLKSAMPPNFALAGNFLTGAGLSACFENAKQAVTKITP